MITKNKFTSLAVAALALALASASFVAFATPARSVTKLEAEEVPSTENLDDDGYILLTESNVTSANPLKIGASYLLSELTTDSTAATMLGTSMSDYGTGTSASSAPAYFASAVTEGNTISNGFVTSVGASTALLTLGAAGNANNDYTFYVANWSAGAGYLTSDDFHCSVTVSSTATSYEITFSSEEAHIHTRDYYDYNYFIKHYRGSTQAATVPGCFATIYPGAVSGYTFPHLYEKYGVPMSLTVTGNAPVATLNETGYDPLASGSSLVISALYRDGRTQDVTSLCTIAKPDTSKIGTQNLAISYSYGGVSASASYACEVTNANAAGETPSEQAAATRDFIQQFKTCEGTNGVLDSEVQRCAKEYNAMDYENTSSTKAKAIFQTLSETVSDYDYSDASQYTSGSYTGGAATLTGVSIYDKLCAMVHEYNLHHSASQIYLYDTVYHDGYEDDGSGNGRMPAYAGLTETSQGTFASSSEWAWLFLPMGLLLAGGLYVFLRSRKQED
jgi:hypothetical protein